MKAAFHAPLSFTVPSMIYFVSDVHLGFEQRDKDKIREQYFLQFLENIQPTCEHLFILGDLFDYWFEYSKAIPRYFFRVLAALDAYTRKGIKITYLMGNHDFGHHTFFQEELGIKVEPNDLSITLNGKRFYLAHGDGKAYNDKGYLALKSILRHPINNALFRLIHPDLGISLASRTSGSSRSYTDKKEYGQRDGLLDFAKQKITDEGYDFVVMGHRHKMTKTPIGNGAYINLGHWLSLPATYGIFDGKNFQLLSTETVVPKQ